MDISQLRYVAAIARVNSFSRAAEQLYVSQSSLSQQIMKLEKEIGYPLFLRTTKRVQLSPEGARFLTQAKCVLREFNTLEVQVEATRSSLAHTINLGVSMIYRPDTSQTVSRFMQEHPDIDLNLTSAWELEILDMLHTGRIDIGLFGVDWENDDLSGVTVIPIRDEYTVAAVSRQNPLSQREYIRLEDLVAEPLIFTSERSAVRRLVLQKFRQQGLIPSKIMMINEMETRLHCVRQNLGVALAMNSTHHWIGQEDIVLLPLEPRLVRTYSMVIPQTGASHRSAVIQLLQDFLLKNLKQTSSHPPFKLSDNL